MDPALVGVLLTVAFGLFAGAVTWCSDIRRVEGKLDGLVMALVRSGSLTDWQASGPPS